MALDFSLERNPAPASAEHIASVFENPGFGVYFTDHMATADFQFEQLGQFAEAPTEQRRAG